MLTKGKEKVRWPEVTPNMIKIINMRIIKKPQRLEVAVAFNFLANHLIEERIYCLSIFGT